MTEDTGHEKNDESVADVKKAPTSEQNIADEHNKNVQRNLDALQKISNDFSNPIIALATIVIMVATVFNVIYVGGQLSEMRSGSTDTHALAQAAEAQAKASVEQSIAMQGQLNEMRADERPKLWYVEQGTKPEYTSNNDPISWNINYANIGKGIVRNGRLSTYMKIGDGPFERSIDEPENGNEFGTLAPNQVFYNTALVFHSMSHMEFSELLKRENSIFTRFHFEYYDLAGQKFESEFCVHVIKSGATSMCSGSQYNYMK